MQKGTLVLIQATNAEFVAQNSAYQPFNILVETDTKRIKITDGTTKFIDLSYIIDLSTLLTQS